MREITLSKSSGITLVDDDVYEWASKYKWALSHKGYAERTRQFRVGHYTGQLREIKHQKVFLHRAIMNPPKGMQVDHVNRDKLDNRRENLRICTQSENQQNSKKRTWMKPTPQSRFKGVNKRPTTYKDGRPKFQARITVNFKRMSLGVFDNEEAAARAYDRAAIKFFGEYALVNFT